MDHETIEEQDVAERYLLGRLGAEDAARFEEHYLDCPLCLEKLELSRRLRDGLKDVAAEEGTKLAGTAVLAWLLRRGRVLQAVLAVALLGVAVLPWALLMREVSRLDGELTLALAPQVGTPTYFLSPERSGPGKEPSTRVTLGPEPEWVVLALQPPPGPARYLVRFRPAGGEALWQHGPVEADAAGRVTLSVHSSWLEGGDYVVELDAVDPQGGSRPVAGFAFRVRRER
jgi:hypothetical protein